MTRPQPRIPAYWAREAPGTTSHYHASGLGVFDGYEFIGAVDRADGWQIHSSWGLDGWDLGDWPYVLYALHEADGLFALMTYVEGDVDVVRFASREELHREVDRRAVDHWRRRGVIEDLPDGPVDDLPDRFRGPFSWPRLNAAKEAAGGRG